MPLVLTQSIAAADMDHAQLEAFLTAQARRQGSGGVSAEQTAALSRFWRSQRARVRESLVAQSRWEPGLRGLSWRVDLQTGASRGSPAHGGPVALVELELGRAGQVRPTAPSVQWAKVVLLRFPIFIFLFGKKKKSNLFSCFLKCESFSSISPH